MEFRQKNRAKGQTYSANAFSTTAKNLTFALAKLVISSLYTAFALGFSFASVLIPKASASLAFLLAIWQSFVHFMLDWLVRVEDPDDVVRPQGTDCLMRPQGHVRVMNA